MSKIKDKFITHATYLEYNLMILLYVDFTFTEYMMTGKSF